MKRVLVYGTLQPGGPNEHVMNAIGGEWHAAMVRGEPPESGWGASQGYPRLRLDTRGEPVLGQIFASANLAANWGAMDAFEGEQYTRVLTDAALEDGTHMSTYVYVLCDV